MSKLFEKSPYVVTAVDKPMKFSDIEYDRGYAVVNTDTGVVELFTVSLPDAIMCAAQYAHALVNKPWEWFDKEPAAPGKLALDVN